MIVTAGNLLEIIDKLSVAGDRGVDCETTGLSEDSELFSIIIGDASEVFYFNFNPNSPSEYLLDKKSVCKLLSEKVFSNAGSTFYISNAKFDMRMLAKEGIFIQGRVHCTQAVERVLRNNYIGKAYGLDACAKRRGWAKDTAVAEYIKEHKLLTKRTVPGKKKVVEDWHFDQVPFEVMAPYGMKDGHLHHAVGKAQEMELEVLESKIPIDGDGNKLFPTYKTVFENELRLTKTLFRMERRGLQINKPYVARALEHEMNLSNAAKKEFYDFTGVPFADSGKALALVFDKMNEPYPRTEKGNPSFAAAALEEMTTPAAKFITRIRSHEKMISTYYSSFLHYADIYGIIHADTLQGGTETGRMSCREPNLQNMPKEDEPEDLIKPYVVRASFIPRPGYVFGAIDYKQMEYRLMLDYAGEHQLIKQINDGADVHQAMADLVGVTRNQAKTLNFAILYGAGIDKIASSLGISVEEATQLRYQYYAKLPRVKNFKDRVIKTGEERGYIFNAFGRRLHIAQRDWAYILPNHIIQGGCADVVKLSMNEIDDQKYYETRDTHMLLQVHDELIFEMPEHELGLLTDIQKIMEATYKPQNGMILATDASWSAVSMAKRDLQKLVA